MLTFWTCPPLGNPHWRLYTCCPAPLPKKWKWSNFVGWRSPVLNFNNVMFSKSIEICHFFVWPYTWCGWEAKVDLWGPKFFLSSLDFLELSEIHSLWRFHQSMESSKKNHFHVFTLCLLTKAHNPYRGWKCPIGSNNVTPVSLKPQLQCFSHFQFFVAIVLWPTSKSQASSFIRDLW